MTDTSSIRHEDDNEAVQAVIDRVLSYQAGAPVETVRAELESGLQEIGENRPDDWLASQAQQISDADPA